MKLGTGKKLGGSDMVAAAFAAVGAEHCGLGGWRWAVGWTGRVCACCELLVCSYREAGEAGLVLLRATPEGAPQGLGAWDAWEGL